MRRALLAATAVLMLLPGTASAASYRPAMVYGHYTYDFSGISGIPGDTRTVTIFAADSSSPKGLFLRVVNGPNAGAYAFGTVACVEVSGRDAWVAGPITRTQAGHQNGSTWALFRIHDGGLPRGAGDRVITFGATPAQGLADCRGMVHDPYDASLVPLVSGNVTVVTGH